MRITAYVLIPFLLLSCTTTVIKRGRKKEKGDNLSNQAKILKCVDFLMREHGVSIEDAGDFCVKNYRR